MDHLEDDVLKLRYLQIAHAAWQIAFGYDQVEIDQGVRFSEISDSIAHLLAAGVADESERRFDVLPETVAPIVSLSMNPRTEPGMYLVVVIAWSVISTNPNGSEGISCLASTGFQPPNGKMRPSELWRT
jgi:hypothetical protein